MARHLRRNGWCIGRHRVRRLKTKMGSAPIYQHPKASQPHPRHKIHPYLLRHLTIEARTQVGWADVTYLPMRRDILWPCRHRPGVCWLRRFIRLPNRGAQIPRQSKSGRYR